MDSPARSELVTVEFFGIARQRVGQNEVQLTPASLGSLLAELATRYPDFRRDCLQLDADDHFELAPSITANLNGDRFLTDNESIVPPGCSLLIMSADAGG